MPVAAGAAIETVALTKRFRHQRSLGSLLRGGGGSETLALGGVSLTVPVGEVCVLIGPNGAGKTTFMKILGTLLLPTSGTARVFGHDVVAESQAVRRAIGMAIADERSFYWRLTGRQNLEFFAALYGLPARQSAARAAELLELFNLTPMGDRRFNEYSTGMRQKLAIARGMLCRPRLLFMDEPTKGLDPVSVRSLLDFIRGEIVGAHGTTILFSTHILSEAEQVGDRIAILKRGTVIACGTAAELKLDAADFDKYLLRIGGIAELALRRICRRVALPAGPEVVPGEGAVQIEVRLRKGGAELAELLAAIVQENGRILACERGVTTLEESFHHLVRDAGSAARPAGGAAELSDRPAGAVGG